MMKYLVAYKYVLISQGRRFESVTNWYYSSSTRIRAEFGNCFILTLIHTTLDASHVPFLYFTFNPTTKEQRLDRN